MSNRMLVAAMMAALGGTSLPVVAQNSRVELVPTAGYMIFGDVLRGPIGSSLSNANGPVFGAQLTVPLAGPLSAYVGGAYARSEMQVGLPLLGGYSIGDSDAFLGDAGLELRAGDGRRASPFVQAGAGAAHYRIRTGFLNTESTSLALVGGVGVDIPISRAFGLRIMAKDYIGTFDFQEATAIDFESRTAHNVALNIGLRLAF